MKLRLNSWHYWLYRFWHCGTNDVQKMIFDQQILSGHRRVGLCEYIRGATFGAICVPFNVVFAAIILMFAIPIALTIVALWFAGWPFATLWCLLMHGTVACLPPRGEGEWPYAPLRRGRRLRVTWRGIDLYPIHALVGAAAIYAVGNAIAGSNPTLTSIATRTLLGATVAATAIGAIFLAGYLAFEIFPRSDAYKLVAARYHAFRTKTCPVISFTE